MEIFPDIDLIGRIQTDDMIHTEWIRGRKSADQIHNRFLVGLKTKGDPAAGPGNLIRKNLPQIFQDLPFSIQQLMGLRKRHVHDTIHTIAYRSAGWMIRIRSSQKITVQEGLDMSAAVIHLRSDLFDDPGFFQRSVFFRRQGQVRSYGVNDLRRSRKSFSIQELMQGCFS